MPGFSSNINGLSVVFANNVDFTGGSSHADTITLNGQLIIGSTALNAGSTHINIGNITSPDSSITVGYSTPNITLVVAGGTTVGKTITGDLGPPLPPSGGNWNIFGGTVVAGTNPVQTSGAGSTLTINVQRSQAVASADTTKVGLANFNSAEFTVSNGFVSLAAGGFMWNDITTATQTIAVQNGYVTDRGGGVTYTLPATANFGDEFIITGKLGLWTVAQNANQSIGFSSSTTTVGATGSLVATNLGDSIWCVCTTAGASTVWRVYNSIGNITVN